MPISQFKLAFEATQTRLEVQSNRFDSLQSSVAYYVTLNRPEVRSMLPQPLLNRFDAFRSGGVPLVLCNRFTAAALRTVLVRNRLDVSRENETTGRFCNGFDVTTAGNVTIPMCWDAENEFPTPVTRLTFGYDSSWAYLWKTSNRFQVISDVIARICNARWPSRFNSARVESGFQSVRFDVIPQDFAATFRNCFDSVGTTYTLHPARKQAFVRPGWKILAKNIVTNEIFELGFIDTESNEPVLENMFLPEGDYEIQVLTSSLFWKDTLDTEIRLISVRRGEEISPLPTIYNLRSTISQGETTIYWSANQSSVSDCIFGVWYSSESPVPTDGPPSETVWYSPEMTEYQTTFRQNAPCYAAVAPIRTGNASEMGKVHELYLDWSNVKPRHPDDVIIFDKPLPAYDPNILTVEQENPEISLWN